MNLRELKAAIAELEEMHDTDRMLVLAVGNMNPQIFHEVISLDVAVFNDSGTRYPVLFINYKEERL